MPTYEYHCDACEHNFDEFQSMSEPALTKCPECGKKKLRRVFGGGAAVLFKGSGFYQTDYKGGGQAASGDKTPAAGGCAPTCGTPEAPAGCAKNAARPDGGSNDGGSSGSSNGSCKGKP